MFSNLDIMSENQHEAQRDISRNFFPDMTSLFEKRSTNRINPPQRSTDHRFVAFYFSPNFQGYSDMHQNHSNPPERPHMTVSTTVPCGPETANNPNQVREALAIDDNTSHLLPGGHDHNILDEDDWTLGSNNPANFEPLRNPYTAFPSI